MGQVLSWLPGILSFPLLSFPLDLVLDFPFLHLFLEDALFYQPELLVVAVTLVPTFPTLALTFPVLLAGHIFVLAAGVVVIVAFFVFRGVSGALALLLLGLLLQALHQRQSPL